MVEPKTKRTPRWEWRTFGPSLSSLAAKIGLAAQIAPRQSDEIYLLNFATPHSAKIRGAMLDVKRLEQVDSNGLELWNPAFKAAFPLSAPMLQSAFSALDLPFPASQRGAYALDEFLKEVVDRSTALRAIRVNKARRRFAFCGCAAEFTHLRIAAVAQDSFCVENEEPTRVLAALRELGLDPHANISFPEGLKRALAHTA